MQKERQDRFQKFYEHREIKFGIESYHGSQHLRDTDGTVVVPLTYFNYC